ncbi:hypothetical protein [Halorubrum persicum]|uniref:hypothetical protein n=1 Tax=Halorubrum persicum TaxID=1383844 RepID=UPI001181914C|nr:hypothetical protein [Halorubrum persicum]
MSEAEDIEIGSNENQTISGIKTRGDEKNVKIRVGSLVSRGADLDGSNSSYTVPDRDDVSPSDVYIKNKDALL